MGWSQHTPTQPRKEPQFFHPTLGSPCAHDNEQTGDTINTWTPSQCSTSTRSRACKQHGVERLRIFGSALTDRFDPQESDIDFLVDFAPGNVNLFDDYFDLKFELEHITGRPVDLIDASAVRNPYFRAAAFGTAQELYAGADRARHVESRTRASEDAARAWSSNSNASLAPGRRRSAEMHVWC